MPRSNHSNHSPFGNLPISRKIVVVCALSSLATLAAITSVSFYREWSAFSARKVSELSTLALILESNVVAALRFDDPYTASKYAESLHHEPDIESVTIFDASGEPFARYARNEDLPTPDAPRFNGALWQESRLLYARSIALDGGPLGSLLIEIDTASFRTAVRHSLLTAIALLLGGLAIALVLANRLQRLITEPIRDLVEVTRKVATETTFAERAPKRYRDEVGSLVDSFNAMLDTVAQSDASLRAVNANLERLVQERTADLNARNAALKEAIDEANAAAMAKSEFLATISHELRTPLNPILGYVEILLREKPPAATARKLSYIKQSAKLLLGLIDDMLEFNRLDRTPLTLSVAPVDCPELCREVVGLMQPEADKRSLDLAYRHVSSSASASEAPAIAVDGRRIRQVLLNLVGNALKFTPSGSVEIRSEQVRFDGSRGVYRIDVVDTGIGIAADDLPLLFKPFSQIDSSLTRVHGGMGLGLAISRKIAESMGGTLTVESEPRQGSRFRLEFPFEVASPGDENEAEEPARPFQSSAPKPILLVEDEPINRELVRFLLTTMGHQVVSARDGAEAVERFEPDAFALVFMDISMPRMDGFAATEAIRNREGDASRVPIIAMTAHISESCKDRCFESGMDGFLSKPLNFPKLEKTIREWLR